MGLKGFEVLTDSVPQRERERGKGESERKISRERQRKTYWIGGEVHCHKNYLNLGKKTQAFSRFEQMQQCGFFAKFMYSKQKTLRTVSAPAGTGSVDMSVYFGSSVGYDKI